MEEQTSPIGQTLKQCMRVKDLSPSLYIDLVIQIHHHFVSRFLIEIWMQFCSRKVFTYHKISSINLLLTMFTIHNSQYLYCLPTYKLMIHNVSTKITFYWHIHIYTSMTSLYYGSKGSWKSYWIYGPLVWYTLSHLSQQGCRGCKGATVITQC